MSIWKKSIFWTKVKDSLAIGAILSQAGLEVGDASELVKLIVAGGSIAAYLVGMWMEDKNNNGVVDLFETDFTTTTTVTSNSPMTVTTSEEEKPKQ